MLIWITDFTLKVIELLQMQNQDKVVLKNGTSIEKVSQKLKVFVL